MLLLEIETFRATPQSAHLLDVLITQLEFDEGVLTRESNGTATDYDVARLTVLRFLFGEVIITKTPTRPIDKTKALVWVRRQKLGRLINSVLDRIIIETRYVYETNEADERTRLLLTAYKKMRHILFTERLEILNDDDTKK